MTQSPRNRAQSEFASLSDSSLVTAAENIARAKYPKRWKQISEELTKRGLGDPKHASSPKMAVSITSNHDKVWDLFQTKKREQDAAWKSFGLFLLSLLLFGFVHSIREQPARALLLLLVVLFHELGHLAAMLGFGYEQKAIFFIPLFGGLAKGRTDQPDARKAAIVALSGPALGLLSCLFSLLIYEHTSEQAYLDYARMAFFINVFNLLPVLPLDGGWFFNSILFSKIPALELFFAILSAAFFVFSYRNEFLHGGTFGLAILAMILTGAISRYRWATVAVRVRETCGQIIVEDANKQVVAETYEIIKSEWPNLVKEYETEPDGSKKMASLLRTVLSRANAPELTLGHGLGIAALGTMSMVALIAIAIMKMRAIA